MILTIIIIVWAVFVPVFYHVYGAALRRIHHKPKALVALALLWPFVEVFLLICELTDDF